MLFPTLGFLFFFTFVLFFNWTLKKWPIIWKLFLLAVSYWFYSFLGLDFIWLLVLVTVFNYLGGVMFSKEIRFKKLLFIFFLLANISILGFFKYYDFFRSEVESLMYSIGLPFSPPVLEIIMPLGISFYIFRAISYVIDVYTKKIACCKSLLDFSIYIAFFPQIFSGPIERAGNFLPQLENGGVKKVEDMEKNLTLILIGLFKKLVIASYLIVNFTDPVFSVPENHSALVAWLAFFAYSVVIYFDFSGYSDMAIGFAGLMGFKSAINFDYPYLSKSIKEFWRKWHISLSQWIRDYVYIPLGGNRKGALRKYIGLVFIMILVGFWHDSSDHYLIWGLMQGLALVVFGLLCDIKDSVFPKSKSGEAESGIISFLGGVIGWFLTFMFVSVSWVIFRCDNLEIASQFFKAMSDFDRPFESFPLYVPIFIAVGFFIFTFEKKIVMFLNRAFSVLPWPLLPLFYASLVLITFKLSQNTLPPFIYFSF